MWSYGAIEPSEPIETASGDNANAKTVNFVKTCQNQKNQLVYHKSYYLTKMSYFLSVFFGSNYAKLLETDRQEIYSISVPNFRMICQINILGDITY